jgi:hypothetical protein
MKDKYNNFSKSKGDINVGNVTSTLVATVDKGAYLDKDKEAIRKYCQEAINTVTYTADEEKIYEYYMHNIMRNLHYDGGITPEDVSTIIQYLSLRKIKELDLRTHFEIVPDYLYTIKYGLTSISSCRSRRDGSSAIYLRKSLFKSVLEKDYFDESKLFYLLETIYHEIVHAEQNDMVCQQCPDIQSKEVLLWLKETIIDDYDPKYYIKNYKNLYTERDANIRSRYMAIDTFNKHFHYFRQRFIDQMSRDAFDYRADTRYLRHLDPLKGYKAEGEAAYIIDGYIDHIAKKYPQAIGNQIAIQYNLDGTRRNSKELNDEYWFKKHLIQTTYSAGTPIYESKIKELQELYDYLIWGAKEQELITASHEEQPKTKKIVYKNR